MLDKSLLFEKYNRGSKEVEVPAWGGTVKIQKLTIKEKTEIESILYANASQKELSKGSFKIDLSQMMAAQIKSISYALVEPSMSIEELEGLTGEAIEGLKQLAKEIDDFNTPKI